MAARSAGSLVVAGFVSWRSSHQWWRVFEPQRAQRTQRPGFRPAIGVEFPNGIVLPPSLKLPRRQFGSAAGTEIPRVQFQIESRDAGLFGRGYTGPWTERARTARSRHAASGCAASARRPGRWSRRAGRPSSCATARCRMTASRNILACPFWSVQATSERRELPPRAAKLTNL
jgi:hypothetical protein